MVPYVNDTLPVDYDKPHRQLFREAVVYIGRQLPKILPLLFKEYEFFDDRLSSQVASTHPTWVPDLCRGHGTADMQHGYRPRLHFKELLGTAVVEDVRDASFPDDRVLRVTGLLMGSCCEARQLPSSASEVAQFLRTMFGAIPESNAFGVRSLATALLAHWPGESAGTDAFLKGLREPAALREEAPRPCETDVPFEGPIWGLKHCLKSLQGVTLMQVMVAGSYRIGVGPGSLRDRDLVVLAPFFRIPTVLRPVDGAGKQFQVVGYAYVDGVMENDSVDDELCARLEKFKPRAFDIV